MAFEGLTEKLSAAFKKLRGKGRLSEADVKEAMREIRLALAPQLFKGGGQLFRKSFKRHGYSF